MKNLCTECRVELLPFEILLCNNCLGEPGYLPFSPEDRQKLLQKLKEEQALSETLSMRASTTMPFAYCGMCPKKGRGKMETVSGELVPFYTSPQFGMHLCVVHLVKAVQEAIDESIAEAKRQAAN